MKSIILAGGGGTRLFPLSTDETPKQFLKLVSDRPMIVDQIFRLSGFCKADDIIVVTNERYAQKTKEILREYGLDGVRIIKEPYRRNTAPAIILSIIYCKEVLCTNEEEPILVFPSDQAIDSIDKFESALHDCVKIINGGSISTIGICPTRYETGYGYIKARKKNKISAVDLFKEKPDLQTAKNYVDSGKYYWNSGIYGFNAKTFMQEIKKTHYALSKMFEKNFSENLEAYDSIESVSIDYALSEKSKNIFVVPFDGQWSDVGTFESLYDFLPKDENGNVIKGDVNVSGCINSLLIAVGAELTVSNLNSFVVVKTSCEFLEREFIEK